MDEAKCARKVCRGIGDKGLKTLNASGLSEENSRKPEESFSKVSLNFKVHRLHLMKYRQPPAGSIYDFLTRASISIEIAKLNWMSVWLNSLLLLLLHNWTSFVSLQKKSTPYLEIEHARTATSAINGVIILHTMTVLHAGQKDTGQGAARRPGVDKTMTQLHIKNASPVCQ